MILYRAVSRTASEIGRHIVFLEYNVVGQSEHYYTITYKKGKRVKKIAKRPFACTTKSQALEVFILTLKDLRYSPRFHGSSKLVDGVLKIAEPLLLELFIKENNVSKLVKIFSGQAPTFI